MLIPAIVRALRQPPFQGSDFTATRFAIAEDKAAFGKDRKSTRLNSSHYSRSRMPSSA